MVGVVELDDVRVVDAVKYLHFSQQPALVEPRTGTEGPDVDRL
jgi:hypothetical protein